MDLHSMAKAVFQSAIVGDKVRLDIFGEVQTSGRIATMLTPDEAMQLSRDLGLKAMHLGVTKTEDLV
jgi:hypothetical protein